MQTDEAEHDSGEDKDVDRKKSAQGRPANRVSPQNEMSQPFADQGNATSLFSCYYYRPSRGLIPAQQLAGKSHGERETEQAHTSRPGHLAREFVGTEQKSLRHVSSDHQHHGRSAVVMESAQKATEGRVVRDEDKRLVGLRRRRDKRKRQRYAARYLHDESNQGRGSENVPPFGVLRRDVLHRLEQ